MQIDFFVPGVPAPGGSKRAFAIRKGGVLTGRVALVDAGKNNKEWRSLVAMAAKQAMREAPPTLESLLVGVAFYLPRPKSHYKTGKNAGILRGDAPPTHTKTPDALKLARAVEDAMTGIVYMDDAQIVQEHISKEYSTMPGVFIYVASFPIKKETA